MSEPEDAFLLFSEGFTLGYYNSYGDAKKAMAEHAARVEPIRMDCQITKAYYEIRKVYRVTVPEKMK